MQEKEIIPKPYGAHAFLDRDKYLIPVAKKYGRDPTSLCLKICYKVPLKPNESLEDFTGGHTSTIAQITKVQNICHWRGLAPRVYAIEIIDWEGQRSVAQLQDYILGIQEGENRPLFDRVCSIVEEYGVMGRQRGDVPWNSIAGKWVDFGSFSWKE